MSISNPLASFAPGGSGAGAWYANNVGYAAAEFITLWANQADSLLSGIDTALSDLDDILEANTVAPTYDPDMGGIVWTHTAPTTTVARGNYSALQPTAVTLPTRGGVMSDAEFNALVADARSKISRAAAGNAFTVMYEAAGMGLGMSTAAQTVALRNASQKTADLTAQAILELTAERGKWNREDYFKVLEAELQSFKDKAQVVWDRLKAEELTLAGTVSQFEAEIKSEAERRGWTVDHVRQIMEEAKVGADVYIQWGTNTLNRLIAAKEAIIQVKAAIAQALLSAADTSLGFSGGQNITTDGNP